MAERHTTSRFVLRPVGDNDLPQLLANFSDRALMRYYDGTPLSTIDAVRELLEKWRHRERKGTGVRWAIALKDSDRLIGTCGFHDIHAASGCAEVGCEVGREYWGRRVMPEVAPVLGRYAFDVLHLNRLDAMIAPRNRASIALIEAFGFRKRRLLRDRLVVNGKRSDILLYSMSRAAYRARTNPCIATSVAALPIAAREAAARLVHELSAMHTPRPR